MAIKDLRQSPMMAHLLDMLKQGTDIKPRRDFHGT